MMTVTRLMTLGLMSGLATLIFLPLAPNLGKAGQVGSSYKVLAPISRGNLDHLSGGGRPHPRHAKLSDAR